MATLDSRRGYPMQKAVKITVKGRVQGVGFRPFIFALAQRYQVKGTVQNNMDGVFIHLEGDADAVDRFIHSLPMEAPRLSRIDEIVVTCAPWKSFEDFCIIPSERTGSSSLVIPIDTAVCDDCLREMYDPNDHRYRYPFINCTQCGPRYTIIEQLPYDRPFTSMRSFQMCERCEQEYKDPSNRLSCMHNDIVTNFYFRNKNNPNIHLRSHYIYQCRKTFNM